MKTYNILAQQQTDITLTKSGSYTIKLTGEGAHVNITGVFSLKRSDKLEIDLIIKHQAPHTSASTVLKAAVDDSAHASINGTIIVTPAAQQTNSFLTEKVLLLSDSASAYAIPNLEIEADDVKCSHAATVSTLDPEMIFYLQARGISITQAKRIIVDGFLHQADS